MPPILSLHMWVNLSAEERNRIRVLFNIPRSSNVIVSDGRIETDGTTPKDFEALSVEKMQSYTGSDSTDFHKQFDLVLSKVKDDVEKGQKSEMPVKTEENYELTAKPHVKKKGKQA